MGCLFEGSGLICILNTKYNIQNACQYFFSDTFKKSRIHRYAPGRMPALAKNLLDNIKLWKWSVGWP